MKSKYEPDSINAAIERAGWFNGTQAEWERIPLAERDEIAFKATGCQVAYATWTAPVDCSHTPCRIRRGELPQIALTNAILRGEKSNWLRFAERKVLAAVFRYFRKEARATGVYDPWKINWQLIVTAGIGA